jgi:hypothetical protein
LEASGVSPPKIYLAVISKIVEEPTLRLKPPFGRTLYLTLLFLLVLLGAGETLTRTHFFRTHFISASRGSPHFQFEQQLGRLETLAAIDGSIDCIFLGNSMVWEGFDPLAFSRAYQEIAGDELRCFNFGVDGLPVTAASGLASYFMKVYQPKLLIYGIDARDFAVSREERDATAILDTPWMRYHLGRFSLEGWLYEHSYFYRYAETLGYLMRMDKQYLLIKEPDQLTSDNLGFHGDDRVGSYVTTSPAMHTDMAPVRYYYKMLSDFQMLPENTSSFEEILSNDPDKSLVLIVVMPVPDTYYDFFSSNQLGYQIFLDYLRESTERYGDTLWLPPNTIPIDGWVDYTHLNTRGAAAFSGWLGRQLGESVLTGQVSNLSR